MKEFRNSVNVSPEEMLIYNKKPKNSGDNDGNPEPPERELHRSNEKTHKQDMFSAKSVKDGDKILDKGSLSSLVITFSEDQKNLLKRIAFLESKRLNIEPIPVVFKTLYEECGYFDPETKTLYISTSPEMHREFLDIVDTVIHEIRHAYQYSVFLFHPEMFPGVSEQIKNYLDYSDVIYPNETETVEGKEKYYRNGLEVDAFTYAAGRIELYKDISTEEIFEMQEAPGRMVHNQILWMPGDSGPDGNTGPVVVGSDFREDTDYNIATMREVLKNFPKSKGDISMSGKRTNISSSAQKEAIKYYSDIIAEIQTRTSVLVGKLKEEVRRHPYSQYQEAVNIFVRYYNSDLPTAIKKAVGDWINSDMSISHILAAHRAGSEAIGNAQKLERELLESVGTSFKQIDELELNVSEMDINQDEIRQSAEHVKVYKSEIESIKLDDVRRIEEMAEENSIYSGILEAVIETFNNVIGAFEGVENTLTNLADEFEDTRSKKVSSNITGGKNKLGSIIDLKDKFLSKSKSFGG